MGKLLCAINHYHIYSHSAMFSVNKRKADKKRDGECTNKRS